MNKSPGTPTDDSKRKHRQLLSNAATAFASLVVAFGLAEAVLWLFFPTPFHEWMEWRPDGHIKGRAEPGTSFKTAEGIEVRINRLGFRGPDPTWQPAENTLRIVVFGGSSTFNYHASSESKTWPQRLGYHLETALGHPVEIVNLALPGFSARESKINYLITGRELHPHVAVMYHTWNDLKFLRRREQNPRSMIFTRVAQNKPLWQRAARLTQTGRLARNALLRLSDERNENYYTTLEQAGARANQMPKDETFDWTAVNFADFAKFARTDGVIPVLVSQATIVVDDRLDDPEYRVAIGNDMVGMTLPIVAAAFQRMERIIDSVSQADGAIYVNGFASVPHDFEHLIDHVHLTERGMDVLGRLIAESLLANHEFRKLAAAVASGNRQPSSRADLH